MAIIRDAELETAEYLNEMQERELAVQEAEAIREHELTMAKLQLKTGENRKIRERVLIALIKAPALLVLSIVLPILVLCNRSIPASLEAFLTV